MRIALASSVIRFLPALAVLRCCECYEAVGSLPCVWEKVCAWR